MFGDGRGTGLPALNYYAPGSIVTRNVMVGGSAALYPPNNYFPSTMSDVKFVNMFAADYRLRTDSPYRLFGTDGKDLGADLNVINTATAGVIQAP